MSEALHNTPQAGTEHLQIEATAETAAPPVASVFISYARADADLVRERARVYRQIGIDVFIDTESIRDGELWPRVLRDRIHSCDQFLLVWSENSAKSGWVTAEYTEALHRRSKEKIDRFIVIERIDQTPLPPELETTQAPPPRKTTRVRITIDKDFSTYSESDRLTLLLGTSILLGVPLDQIGIETVEPGSVIVTLELEDAIAKELVERFTGREPALARFAHSESIVGIALQSAQGATEVSTAAPSVVPPLRSEFPRTPMSVPKDEDLLVAWSRGHREMDEKLAERHYEMVSRFFANKVDDKAEANELIQRTFIQSIQGADSIRGRSSFRTYLLGCATNILREHSRSKPRLADMSGRPLSQPTNNETKELVSEALRRISLEHQILLELRYWENLTIIQLGEVLQLPVDTVRARLGHARQLLARAMAELDGSSEQPVSASDDLDLSRWVAAMLGHPLARKTITP